MPSSTDAATLQAYFDGVEEARANAEAKWGAGRLELLATDDLRAKFYRTRVSWSAAYQTAWQADMLTRDMLEAVTAKAAAMQRAWSALDAAAEEAGHRPIFPDVMEAMLADGSVAAIVRTDAEASKIIADGRHVHVYTLAEVANIIDALPDVLKVAKVEFPGAKFVGGGLSPRDRSWVKGGDEIPFPVGSAEAA